MILKLHNFLYFSPLPVGQKFLAPARKSPIKEALAADTVKIYRIAICLIIFILSREIFVYSTGCAKVSFDTECYFYFLACFPLFIFSFSLFF